MSNEIIVLENDMCVERNEVCTYTAKTVIIKSLITVEGTLIFKDCEIKVENGQILVCEKLNIDGCEISGAENAFIHVLMEASAHIENSEFLYTKPFRRASIIADEADEFIVENCSFRGSFLVMSKVVSIGKRLCIPTNVASLIEAKNGVFRRCTFEGFSSCRVIKTASLEECIFENCHSIQLGGTGDASSARFCKFRNCESIDVYDGEIDWTEFDNIQSLYLESSNILICTFKNMKCCDEYAIFLENTDIRQCEFEDVVLMNDSYLIEAVGDSWIWDCTFLNCRTTREDLEIIHGEEQLGCVFKNTKCIQVVDEESCVGLDHVIRWEEK